jgi:hypothetical protein
MFVNAEACGPKCRGLQLIPTGCERREDPREAFGLIRVVDLPRTPSAVGIVPLSFRLVQFARSAL